MASVFKRRRKVKLPDGRVRVKESLFWYIEFRDRDGRRRRVRGYKDKAATRQKAALLEREAERCEAGLTDKYAVHKKRPLTEHLEDFRQSLVAGNTETHVKVTYSRVTRIAEGCKFVTWSDISGSKVKNFLTELLNTGEISKQTYNYYLTSFRQFCRWLVRDGRAERSPLEYLDRLMVEKDEYRRALEPTEVERLLGATEKAATRFGMTGHERAVLYLLTTETGLRVRELRSLTVGSFDFDKCTVRVDPQYTKNRKGAVQLLKRKRASQLQEFFAGKLPKVRAFNMPSSYRTAQMLKADLMETKVTDKTGKVVMEAIPYVDSAGRKADFYCLRHTLATALDRTGASLKERMAIMRHSDKSNLTLGVYSHVRPYDLRRAIENLPDYKWPGTQEAQAAKTGTDDMAISTGREWTGKWTQKWTGTAYPDSVSMSSDGTVKGQEERLVANMANVPNPLNLAGLETEKNPVSPSDNRADSDGPGRIRTYDQWIMSPLL